MTYEELLRFNTNKKIEENKKEFKKYLETSAGIKKINNCLESNKDLEGIENVKQDALNGNPYAIALLRKNPKRQNVSEKTFFEFTNLEKLPQTGVNSIRIGNSKAADFKIGEYLGTQKYIKEAGGAQDNQLNDAIFFAKECDVINQKCIICIDGKYGKDKIRKMLKDNSNIIITNADELKKDISIVRYN